MKRCIVNMEANTKFGRWLRDSMELNLWSCADVAKMLRTTRQTIAFHINGNVTPSYVWCIAYGQLFGIDPEEIYSMTKEDL